MAKQLTEKWRPSLHMIVSAVLVSVLVLPLMVIVVFGISDDRSDYQAEIDLLAQNVVIAGLIVLAITLAIAYVFSRTIAGPVHELIRRTNDIGKGDRQAIRPLRRHGSREIAKLSESFLDMAERLYDRTDYVANLAAHVSHELKSPLTSIQGAAELLREAEGAMTAKEREKFLNNIISDADRLNVLVGRLRDLAKADSPQIGGHCNLAEAISEIKQDFTGLSLILAGDGGTAPPPIIPLSRDNLHIVLKHLLENALQHGAQEVHITAALDHDAVVLAVEDDGKGISPSNQDRVFDAFFTTKREQGGTGMGLGIVRAMLRAHGGSIRLLPDRKGACFEVRLPAPQN